MDFKTEEGQLEPAISMESLALTTTADLVSKIKHAKSTLALCADDLSTLSRISAAAVAASLPPTPSSPDDFAATIGGEGRMNETEFFLPASGASAQRRLPAPTKPRWGHSLCQLHDGRWLLSGGVGTTDFFTQLLSDFRKSRRVCELTYFLRS